MNAKYNVFVLALAQAVNGAIGPILISLGALCGAYLSPDHLALATLPIAIRGIGMAIFSMPAALLCKRIGRKFGFATGAVIGILGAVLASYSLIHTQFWLFCVSYFLLGFAGTFLQQYRFAAADQGDDKFKSLAISWVMTGGVLAALIGTKVNLLTKDTLLPTPYAGAFLGAAGLLCLGFVILLCLKPLPKSHIVHAQSTANARPLSHIIRQPVFLVALLCAVSSFALMTFVMSGAPLAMHHHGHSEAHAINGIKWHILAMFAPSFITGNLIVKFGKMAIIGFGLSLLIFCSIVALSGLELWNFWVSLILLGIGWNFAFIGATALLGESYTEAEKNTTQGFHDTILFGIVAFAALSSGAVLNAYGWHTVVALPIPVASISLVALFWLAMSRKKKHVDIKP
ncbi:MAG: MFS transporter [Robiginitomaculum sp.]|nr:MAG: MFS transporter [Robiginitomaculum sp.]